MNYAAILAGGSGARMGNPDKPKQFYLLGDKPVLIHTVEKFCVQGVFEKVLVLCPETWVQQTKDLIARHCPQYNELIEVVVGGAVRNETVFNAIKHIEAHYTVDEKTILVTHDAVRPFVSHKIIENNIKAATEHGACDTVVPATDTIVESTDATFITGIPNRKALYQGQTPQSFKLLNLKKLLESLNEEEKEILTDACKIFVLRNEKVALVEGDASNMKITYPHDMRLAHALLEEPSC
jgi:2-C-methyl-D-erythritol 4-phosphate cytidylyltransferase